jgi:hypothetical protein
MFEEIDEAFELVIPVGVRDSRAARIDDDDQKDLSVV